MQAHPHGDGTWRERVLARERGSGGPGGGREGNEECVPLRVDLHATLGGERLAQEAAVLGERCAVALGA